MKEETKMFCIHCNQELQVWARGKDIRVFKCSRCSENSEEKIFIQPTTKLKAVREVLKMSSLIDMATETKQTTLLKQI